MVRRVAGLVREEPLPPRPLAVAAAALVAGSVGVRWLPVAAPASVALPCWLGSVAALAAWVWSARRSRPRIATGALVAAMVAAGAAWSAACFDLFASTDLAWQLTESPRPVAVRGTVTASPRLLTPPAATAAAAAIGPASELVLAVSAVRDGDRWRPARGEAAVVVRDSPIELLSGTEVQIFGRGLRPAAPFNPGEFDAVARARAERRLSILRVGGWDCLTVLARPQPWSPLALLDRLRIAGGRALAAGISAERAPVAAALLLGQREALPRAATDDFVATGTIHVLSISGLHVGLLAAGLFATLRGLLVPRGAAVVTVAVVTGAYAVITGAETPVVRATLMVWVACLAMVASRRGSTLNALAAAAVVLVSWRPAEALSAGAQLSFLSTAVLVAVARAAVRRAETDPIARLIDRSRPAWEKAARRAGRGVLVAFVTGLAVWLATAPLVAARFHVVSPVGLVANVVIAPLVPVAMACGFLCLLTACVSPAVAAVFAAGCDAALALLDWIVAAAAAVPGGHGWVAGPPAWWVMGWYAIFAVAVIWGRRELLRRPATWATLAGGWAAVGLVVSAVGAIAAPGPAGMRVVMAAVGHGCGILVRGPTGRSLLYDAGRLGAPEAACRSISAVLWSERVTRIDTLVVSHADADHFNAVPELLARFPVGELVVPERFAAGGSPAVSDLLAVAAERGVPVRAARAGASFPLDPLCRVRVLHPEAGVGAAADAPPDGDDNASSLVIAVEAAGRRLLLTGDLDGSALAAFAAAAPGACDVLVAPHHGSVTSLPADIARATSPSLVLVSGRGGRAWPEVSAAYEAAAGGAAVLKTGGEGAVAVTLAAGGISVERFRDGRWRASPAHAAAGRAGLVSNQPAASRNNWLATYPARSRSTPLVKP
ncbi:MAG: ComEC/Rec2 family competence protein [Planctomycetota bacterium]